jgi:hypothetical protein
MSARRRPRASSRHAIVARVTPDGIAALDAGTLVRNARH